MQSSGTRNLISYNHLCNPGKKVICFCKTFIGANPLASPSLNYCIFFTIFPLLNRSFQTMNIPVREILFWDLDTLKMDAWKNRRIIIERVFNLGNLDELKFIFKHYGSETIRKEIVRAGNLDQKTLQFASDLLKIPKEEFRCYRQQRSATIF